MEIPIIEAIPQNKMFGEAPRRAIIKVKYTIIDVDSLYNVILRPVLNASEATL